MILFKLNNLKLTLFVLYFCLSLSNVWGQSISIVKAINMILNRDPGLKACYYQTKYYSNLIKKRKDQFMPSYSFSSSTGIFDNHITSNSFQYSDDVKFNSKEDSGEFYNIGASLYLPIIKEKTLFGHNAPSITSAIELEKKNKYECRLLKQSTIKKVLDIFLSYFQAQREIKIFSEEVKFYNWLLEQAQKKYEKGIISNIDVINIDNILQQKKLSLQIANNNLLITKKRFAILLDNEPKNLELETNELINLLNYKLPSLSTIKKTIHNHPQLEALRANKQHFYYKYRQSKNLVWPEIGMTIAALFHKEHDSPQKNLSYLLFSLNWNIDLTKFDLIKEDFNLYLKAKNMYKNSEKNILYNTLIDLQNIKQQQFELQQQLQLNFQKSLKEKLTLQFLKGLIDPNELINCTIDIEELEKEIVTEEINLINNIIIFKQNIGISWNE